MFGPQINIKMTPRPTHINQPNWPHAHKSCNLQYNIWKLKKKHITQWGDQGTQTVHNIRDIKINKK